MPWTSHTYSLEDGGGCRRKKGDWSPYIVGRALRELAGMYTPGERREDGFRGSATSLGGFLILSSRAQQ